MRHTVTAEELRPWFNGMETVASGEDANGKLKKMLSSRLGDVIVIVDGHEVYKGRSLIKAVAQYNMY